MHINFCRNLPKATPADRSSFLAAGLFCGREDRTSRREGIVRQQVRHGLGFRNEFVLLPGRFCHGRPHHSKLRVSGTFFLNPAVSEKLGLYGVIQEA